MSKENKTVEPILTGDKVEIIDLGFQRMNGSGEVADGRGWIRVVGNISNGIYELYNENTMAITGYYPRKSIKKVEEEER